MFSVILEFFCVLVSIGKEGKKMMSNLGSKHVLVDVIFMHLIFCPFIYWPFCALSSVIKWYLISIFYEVLNII
jgi:hypothetical protein